LARCAKPSACREARTTRGESFFATLKKELVHGCAFETRSEAYDAISNYIENYYNAKRLHCAVGNVSPINFELANSGQLAA
jgi:transposase InsO family protein